MKKIITGLCTAGVMLSAFPAAAADVAGVTVDWGGFVRLQASESRSSDGAPATNTIGRDIYLPAASVPVSATPQGKTYFNAQAKETRLWLKANTDIGGQKVGGYVEFDFISGAGGTFASIQSTNGYQPALRRAFVTYNNFLFGQEFSTLINLSAYPESVSFFGPSEGGPFVRQAQARYTHGPFQVSLEKPDTFTSNVGATTADTGDNTLPDVVLRYNLDPGKTKLSLAGVARQLTQHGGTASDTTAGFGLSLAGKIPLGTGGDDIRFMFSGGNGFGRYLGLASTTDVTIVNNKFRKLTVYDGYIALHHPWNDQWRSNLILSGLKQNLGEGDTSAIYGTNASKRSLSAAANIFYSPIKPLSFGAEFRYAKRDTAQDLSGHLYRAQFSVTYAY